MSGPGFLGTQESVYLFIQGPQAATVYRLPSLPHTHPSLRQCLAVGKSVGPALCFLDRDKLQGFSALSGHCPLLLFLYGTLQYILTFLLCSVSSVNCLLTSLSQSPWGLTGAGSSVFGCHVLNMKCPPQLIYLRILSSAAHSAWGGGCDTLRRQPSWRKWVTLGRASLEVNNPALFSAPTSCFANMSHTSYLPCYYGQSPQTVRLHKLLHSVASCCVFGHRNDKGN